MADYAPPPGPPPPKAPDVPAGWAARWNDQYKEWFYVNIHTKQSQWEKPTAPVFPDNDSAPSGPPPGYAPSDGPAPTDTKVNPYDDPAQATRGAGGSSSTQDEDAKLAAKLQAEEDARARSGYGGPTPPAGYGSNPASPYPQSNSPYPQNNSPYPQNNSPYPTELPPRDRGGKSGGLLGKLMNKGKQMASGGSHSAPNGGYGQPGYPPQQQYYQQQPYQQQPYQQQYQQQPQYGYGQPPMGYGQPQYGAPGGYGRGGYGGGRKPGGGGMGMAGGAALGVGAGLIGGALIADAIHDNEQDAYQDGFDDGADFGGD